MPATNPNYEGWCKRIDLNLRSKHPYLETRVYKVSWQSYVIYVSNLMCSFAELNEEFNHSIRFVTAPVRLAELHPDEFECELESISDENVPLNFEGLPLTSREISNYFECVFPEVSVTEVAENHDQRIISVTLEGELSASQILRAEHYAAGIKNPYRILVRAGGQKEHRPQLVNDPFFIQSSNSLGDSGFEYMRRDEELWYSNIEKIYQGQFSKGDLPFFNEKNTACLVDFSVYCNVNLRNLILLYDEVYCILPLLESTPDFLEAQKLSKQDLLFLVQKGRLKFVSVQPEYRLDSHFLQDAFDRRPDSVVSRRAVSALLASEFGELKREYIFADPELFSETVKLLPSLAKVIGISPKLLAQVLFWPLGAYRASFTSLDHSGAKAIPSFGVNQVVLQMLPENIRKNVELEFLVSSESIHIAHALDATYYPGFDPNGGFSEHPFSSLMGGALNFYKSCTLQSGDNPFVKYGPNSVNPGLELVSIFEVNDFVPIEEFEDHVSSVIARDSLRSLFQELAEAVPQERIEIICEYNSRVETALKKKRWATHTYDLSLDGAGMFIPFLSTGSKLARYFSKSAIESTPLIKDAAEYVEENWLPNDSISRRTSILAGVNRVARLRRIHS